jgi:serine protease
MNQVSRITRSNAARLAVAALLLGTPATAPASDDATPPEWKRVARVESLADAPAPPHPVAICFIDSGVDLTPDTEPVVVARSADDGGSPDDVWPAQEGAPAGHGSHVVTFAAGQVNGWGSSGVWPQARIVSVRAFSPGEGRARAHVYTRAVRACRQHPDVKVIGLSVAGPAGNEAELRDLGASIRLARQHDVSVVAAAGNGGGAVEFPGTTPETLTVGAATADGAHCPFSARGPEVDVVAPGCSLSGSDLWGAPASFGGTSFAVPQVAAVIAALRAYGAQSAEEAERLVRESARVVPAGRALDGAEAFRSAGLGSMLDERAVGAAPKPTADITLPLTMGDGFVDLPRPLARARYDGRSRRVEVKVRNRPKRAAVQLRWPGGDVERLARRLSARCRLKPRHVRVRYISDLGASPWQRVRVHPW